MRPNIFARPARLARLITIGALLVAGTSLAGCANRDNMSTGALPDDYRTRHPIVIAEAEHAIDVPVGSSDRRLTAGARDVIRGFAQSYTNSSTGTVQILVPRGSANAEAASSLRKDIRGALVGAGVPANRLVEVTYQAEPYGDAAPVRLSYTAITAKTAPCGNWPKDLVVNTIENKNYENFGCASQANLAAQISNPLDLLGPRAMSPIDAVQRGQVIKDYRGIDSGDDGGTTINFN
ncbi:CpaD family pilus assembly protein [Rhizobium sp. LjRoot98]|uniref:CpaD family pilus assembly protein n=1 Tax=unclassified Rhizobium TaxID=2613769 RepID=UPI000714CB2B|nr:MULTISPECIES: CpaD family pilus assembly protein [unclassified Rhizobium]KQV42461.1 pilus assembly protein [Rhizobium sp. Root1204]KQY18518.1 pilus assembly protein [Rhizobium sp. Root1334]KRB98703.1 pilus assembly protein [Rhizobium sp. Root73]